jgi:hypothetical protein
VRTFGARCFGIDPILVLQRIDYPTIFADLMPIPIIFYAIPTEISAILGLFQLAIRTGDFLPQYSRWYGNICNYMKILSKLNMFISSYTKLRFVQNRSMILAYVTGQNREVPTSRYR